ncbi:MAG: hypothetical protein P4L40_07950 [Terracidiphilus sp.]|nr:hypothetical protein [Terracidiphilus sp.]
MCPPLPPSSCSLCPVNSFAYFQRVCERIGAESSSLAKTAVVSAAFQVGAVCVHVSGRKERVFVLVDVGEEGV